MNVEPEQIINYRLDVHHLNEKIESQYLTKAAGVCGLQNSPPGSWETALFNRLKECSLQMLQSALYEEKVLLQAWSLRGAPFIFPTNQKEVFLTALTAQEGEQPWIYTAGIAMALKLLQMPFDELLGYTKEAAAYLDDHTVRSKETLDSVLAEIIQDKLPEEKQNLWSAPSMYGNPDKQTVGGAVVSFMLRPCSFSSLVVFGRRQGNSPTFTSPGNWLGPVNTTSGLVDKKEAERELVRKFLHSYGPAVKSSFMAWLGSSKAQADRLWNAVADEMEPVSVRGKTCQMLSADMKHLLQSGKAGDRLMLLGAHDPYLDIKDKSVILENQLFQRAVWKTVANPGVIIKGGRITGIWKTKTQKDKLVLAMTLFAPISAAERKKLVGLSEEYAMFRLLNLTECKIDFS